MKVVLVAIALSLLAACGATMPAAPTNLTVSGDHNTVTITTMSSTMGSLSVPLSGLPGL